MLAANGAALEAELERACDQRLRLLLLNGVVVLDPGNDVGLSRPAPLGVRQVLDRLDDGGGWGSAIVPAFEQGPVSAGIVAIPRRLLCRAILSRQRCTMPPPPPVPVPPVISSLPP